jgi:hypothetical protein
MLDTPRARPCIRFPRSRGPWEEARAPTRASAAPTAWRGAKARSHQDPRQPAARRPIRRFWALSSGTMSIAGTRTGAYRSGRLPLRLTLRSMPADAAVRRATVQLVEAVHSSARSWGGQEPDVPPLASAGFLRACPQPARTGQTSTEYGGRF